MQEEISSPAGRRDEHAVVGPDQARWRIAASRAADLHIVSCRKGLIARLYWHSGHL